MKWLLTRSNRVGLFHDLLGHAKWFKDSETVKNQSDAIVQTMKKYSTPTSEPEERSDEIALAHDLLFKVAKIDREAISELHRALQAGDDAYANSITDRINHELEASLNFPHWWVQDRHFRLVVSPRDYDLVFTIRDRTNSEYSFGERSSGLRYFLSYYVQYLAHLSDNPASEILLMDEPDAYLSSQGQQDLLKIFEAFAFPEDHRRSSTQVVYVTHSPFLIDRNHGERIRVLQKGVGDEGTRVVRDVSRNHYEPLRSAFGALVGETAFIGNCNLVVDGPADQVLLAGAARLIKTRGGTGLEYLDLNKTTIVPASGSSQIPYIVYLARGRDVEKPAVIVLLDSDNDGKEAANVLRRGGPRRKQLLDPEYILELASFTSAKKEMRTATGKPAIETEDLVPVLLCVTATKRYFKDLYSLDDATLSAFTADEVLRHVADGKSIFDAVSDSLKKIDKSLHIEKLGFARAVIDEVFEIHKQDIKDAKFDEAIKQFESNFKMLFRALNEKERNALRVISQDKLSRRIKRAKKAFLQDHPGGARKEYVYILLEDIESVLDESNEGDQVRAAIQEIKREFEIDDTAEGEVHDYEQFKTRLEALEYVGLLNSQKPDVLEDESSVGSQHRADVEVFVPPTKIAPQSSAKAADQAS